MLPTPASDLNCVQAQRCTIALCAGLLITFAALAWSAVTGKSPTADECYHALAGWLHLWKGDYRYDCEDPPLWNTLAAGIVGPHGIQVDPTGLDWSNLPVDVGAEYKWEVQTLFRTPGNDPTAFIRRFRAVMLAAAVAMGAFLAFFVWHIARSWHATPPAAGAATVLATGLFALDPNFLAHSPLMKNDVASAFALLGLIASTWSAGRALTPRRGLTLGIWSSIAMTVKFNGPLLAGISAVLLLLRAISPWPWMIGIRKATARPCVSRIKRVQVAAAMFVLMGIMTFTAVWLSYGLRFAPSKEPGSQMNMDTLASSSLVKVWEAKHWDGIALHPPTLRQADEMSRPPILRIVLWANKRHVLPQSFLAGLLYVFQAAQTRGTFLYGESGPGIGRWWYFPFAMAVKTPLATLTVFAAILIEAAIKLFGRKNHSPTAKPPALPIEAWTALCLGVPVVIFLCAAMSSNLNLGVRHVLPFYPLLFAATGLGMVKLWDWHRATGIVLGLIVITALAVESCRAYPNYIPFFNALAGGSRGGLRLLSDSNLDWGQDLPLLAAWQRSHPDQKLYLAYFGTADPAYYGIRYTNVFDGYFAGPPAQPIDSPGVLAISATTLQGPYSGHTFNMPSWSTFWKFKPFEVLGGSIYLFHVPPTRDDYLPLGKSLIE